LHRKWDVYIGLMRSQFNGGLANAFIENNNVATTAGLPDTEITRPRRSVAAVVPRKRGAGNLSFPKIPSAGILNRGPSFNREAGCFQGGKR